MQQQQLSFQVKEELSKGLMNDVSAKHTEWCAAKETAGTKGFIDILKRGGSNLNLGAWS